MPDILASSINGHDIAIDPWESARVGDLKAILKFIDLGGNINQRDQGNNTPLHWACQSCHFDVVSVLVSRGADVNTYNDLKSTPLHYSSREGSPGIVSSLIHFGADVEARNKDNLTALHVAAGMGRTNIARILLDNGSNIEATDTASYTPLWRATYYGHVDTVKVLIDAGANIFSRNKKGRIPGSVFAPSVPLSLQKEIRDLLGVASTLARDSIRADELSMISNMAWLPQNAASNEAEIISLRAALHEKNEETSMLRLRLEEVTAELKGGSVHSVSEYEEHDDELVTELKIDICSKEQELKRKEIELEDLKRKNEIMAFELKLAREMMEEAGLGKAKGCNIKNEDSYPETRKNTEPEICTLFNDRNSEKKTVCISYSTESDQTTSTANNNSDQSKLAKSLMLTQREINDKQRQFTALRRVRADHAASLVELEDNLKAMKKGNSTINEAEEAKCYCVLM